MMNAMIRALVDYLADCDLPLYLADAVPDNTPFPYMTAEVCAPLSPENRGSITLTVWCADSAANTSRLIHHDALTHLFPARGVCLSMDEGRAVIRPGGAAKCVQSGEARGASVPLDVHFFPAA